MITFSKTTNGFIVEFSNNELFLDEGTISLPLNSLSLTIDASDIATFKKSGNGDVFFSGLITNITFGETSATKQNISSLFSDTCCDNGSGDELDQRVAALETTVGDSNSGLVKDVDTLETTVGDNNSGLVKDVNDLGTSVSNINSSVSTLQTTVGDSNSGLVKDVNDIETTVGDNNSGLVHDVSTMSSSVSSLQTTVGDSTSGLVKDVDDLETTIIDDERVTAEALTELRRMIEDINDTVYGLNLRLTQAESEITTLDTVMSAAVNQLS